MHQIIDSNGDGIYEIMAEKMNGEEVLYDWRAGIIGDFGSILPTTIPRNRLEININTDIEKLGTIYRYNYRLHNLPSSSQKLERFVINCDIDTLMASGIPENWVFFNIIDRDIIEWSVNDVIDYTSVLIPIGGYEEDSILS